MPFSRITRVLVACLLVTGVVAAQDDNPFAKWDRLKEQTNRVSRTPAVPAPAPRTAGNVAYFSPDSPEARPPGNSSAEAPINIRRERLRVARSSEVPAAGVTVPATLTTSQDTAGNTGRVRVAAFQSDDDNTRIRLTGAEAPPVSADSSSNPFAEFHPAEVSATSVFDASPPVTSEFVVEEAQPALPARAAVFAPAAPLDGPQSPSVTLQWIHHDEFSVGQECRFDLVIENTGRSTVKDVIARAVLPKGLQVIRAEPAPVAAGEVASWNFNELSPGQKETIQLVAIPRRQGDIRLDAFIQLTGASSSSRSVTKPELAIKLDGSRTAGVGQQVAYTVNVTNPGTGTARNVVIQAAIPDGMRHRQGSLLTIEIGTLNPGELRRAQLNMTAIKGGQHKIAVRVVADGDLLQETAQAVAIAEPKLNIGVRGPVVRKTGQRSTFEVVVVNEGSVESSNVRAKYHVPAGFEFVRADAGGKFTVEDRTIEWFVGNLEPNRVRKFQVILDPLEPGETIHQVGVVSEHGGMTLAEHSTTVEGSADLTLNVTTDAGQIRTGEAASFELRIENKGSSAATTVGLSCELPAGLQLVDISGPSEYIADNGVVIFRSLPTLEPGKTAVFTISTRCQTAGSHKLRARVASDSITAPLIAEKSTIGLE